MLRDHKSHVSLRQVLFAGMMQYDGELHLPTHYLVPPPDIERTSGQYLVHNDIATFACSEVNPRIHASVSHFPPSRQVSPLTCSRAGLKPCNVPMTSSSPALHVHALTSWGH